MRNGKYGKLDKVVIIITAQHIGGRFMRKKNNRFDGSTPDGIIWLSAERQPAHRGGDRYDGNRE